MSRLEQRDVVLRCNSCTNDMYVAIESTYEVNQQIYMECCNCDTHTYLTIIQRAGRPHRRNRRTAPIEPPRRRLP